jgi:hypothetical protein
MSTPVHFKSEGTRARCAWEVTAGLIPGTPIGEHTKRWCLTGETWEAENSMTEAEFQKARPDGRSTFIEFRDAAYEYARSLTDPRYINWVRVDWIWF